MIFGDLLAQLTRIGDLLEDHLRLQYADRAQNYAPRVNPPKREYKKSDLGDLVEFDEEAAWRDEQIETLAALTGIPEETIRKNLESLSPDAGPRR